MAFRFRRTKQIIPGLRLNATKRGASVRFGRRGLGYTVSTTGRRTMGAGIPGSGLHFMSSKGGSRSGTRKGRSQAATATSEAPDRRAVDRAIPKAGFFASGAERRYREGIVALASSDWAGASEAFEQAVKGSRHPGSADLYLGHALAQQEDAEGACQALERFTWGQVTLPDRWMRKYLAGVRLQATLAIGPGIPVELPLDETATAFRLAEIYRALDRPEAAVLALERVASSGVAAEAAALALASMHADQEEWQEVIGVTQGITNEDDISMAAVTLRARALRNLGLNDGALELLRDALKFRSRGDRAKALARYERGLIHEALGRSSRARKDFEGVYALDPAFEDVAERLGLA